MSDTEPIQLLVSREQAAGGPHGLAGPGNASTQPTAVFFNRQELNEILALYGRKVAAGEWRDYALDFGREQAVFAVYRRSSEVPLYQIRKTPRLARKEGAFSVVAATGLILKRGPELRRVLAVLEKSARLV